MSPEKYYFYVPWVAFTGFTVNSTFQVERNSWKIHLVSFYKFHQGCSVFNFCYVVSMESSWCGQCKVHFMWIPYQRYTKIIKDCTEKGTDPCKRSLAYPTLNATWRCGDVKGHLFCASLLLVSICTTVRIHDHFPHKGKTVHDDWALVLTCAVSTSTSKIMWELVWEVQWFWFFVPMLVHIPCPFLLMK